MSKAEFSCEICEKKFSRRWNLKTHMLTHLPKDKRRDRYMCEYCDKGFVARNNLRRHQRAQHPQYIDHPPSNDRQSPPAKPSLPVASPSSPPPPAHPAQPLPSSPAPPSDAWTPSPSPPPLPAHRLSPQPRLSTPVLAAAPPSHPAAPQQILLSINIDQLPALITTIVASAEQQIINAGNDSIALHAAVAHLASSLLNLAGSGIIDQNQLVSIIQSISSRLPQLQRVLSSFRSRFQPHRRLHHPD
eukprot:GABV01001181.1.p1 GENE.GABV01001181.1~~GABV01001181.1.p1  ORF type:complete len:245 (-),score=46.85 GABV01001181.1:80-814(-)